MKKSLFLLALALPALSPGRAIEISLEYVRHEETRTARTFQPSGFNAVPMRFALPPGEWELPPLIGPRPIHGKAVVGGEERLFVLSRQNEDDVFYNRLHFDVHGNGDLTEVPAIDGDLEYRRDRDSAAVTFPVVDMQVTYGEQQVPYSFNASMRVSRVSRLEDMSEQEREHMLMLFLRSNCHYEGAFTLGEARYRMALADFDVNGRFDDVLSLQRVMWGRGGEEQWRHGRSDRFYLSDGDRLSLHDWYFLGNHLVLQDRVFEVQVDIGRGVMTLTEKEEGLVALELGGEAEQLTIVGRENGSVVMAQRPGAAMQVPEDTYRLAAYRMLREDEWGDRWVMRGDGDERTLFTTVAADTDAVLAFGDPIMGAVTGLQPRQGAYRLSFRLRGAGDERIGEVSRISGSNTQHPLSSRRRSYPGEPAFQIVASDGEVVYSGNFDYG